MHRLQPSSLASSIAAVLSGLLLIALTGCATPDMNELRAADLVLLGEQHDAPAHHALEQRTVYGLTADRRLAVLLLEMAEQGRDTTGLAPTASPDEVRQALAWNEMFWPWKHYGPTVMTAVRAGVTVRGANLPTGRLRAAMADTSLDQRVTPAELATLRQRIRVGHCELLPERQIAPMARVQIARDLAMAQMLQAALTPGQTVLLITGRVHADKTLGVPRHLPGGLRVVTVGLGTDPMDTALRFDRHWPAAAPPAQDYCARLQRQPGTERARQ